MRYLFPYFLSVATLSAGCSASAAEEKKLGPPVRIITLGDSITKGVRPGVKADETFAAVLQVLLKKDGLAVEVINVGIGGENTAQALGRLKEQIIDRKPALVTIMYGTNDSYIDKGRKEPRITTVEYRANLTKLVSDLRGAGITPILMTPPRWGEKASPDGSGANPNKSLEPYVKIVREVARETKTPLVDHFEDWSKAAKDGTDIDEWMTDSCHPNPKGHERMAGLIKPVMVATLRAKLP